MHRCIASLLLDEEVSRFWRVLSLLIVIRAHLARVSAGVYPQQMLTHPGTLGCVNICCSKIAFSELEHS